MARDLRRGTIKRVEGVRFPLFPQVESPLTRLNGVEFVAVDLSLNGFGGQLRSGLWSECRFDDVLADSWKLGRMRIVGCSFTRFESGRIYTGGAWDSEFEDCTFQDCLLVEPLFRRSRFTRVQFDGVRGRRFTWRECWFDSVSMAGRVATSHLIDCDFRRVDLSSMHLVEGSLLNAKTKDIDLPALDDAFLVSKRDMASAFETSWNGFSDRSREAIEQLRNDPGADGRDGFEVRLDPTTFWSAGLMADIFGIDAPDAKLVAETLRPVRLRRLPD